MFSFILYLKDVSSFSSHLLKDPFLITHFGTMLYIAIFPYFRVLCIPPGNLQDYILTRDENKNHSFPPETYEMENSEA